jgi:hypothetical protein
LANDGAGAGVQAEDDYCSIRDAAGNTRKGIVDDAILHTGTAESSRWTSRVGTERLGSERDAPAILAVDKLAFHWDYFLVDCWERYRGPDIIPVACLFACNYMG